MKECKCGSKSFIGEDTTKLKGELDNKGRLWLKITHFNVIFTCDQCGSEYDESEFKELIYE